MQPARILLLTLLLVTALSACGDGTTTSPPTTSTEATGPTSTLPASSGSIEVSVDEVGYTFPATVCLILDGDLAQTTGAARDSAQSTEDLAGRFASGWPTTTAPLLDEIEAREAEIRAAGVATLVLAERANIRQEILDRWANDLPEGRTANIESRLDGWLEAYPAVVEEVVETCRAVSN